MRVQAFGQRASSPLSGGNRGRRLSFDANQPLGFGLFAEDEEANGRADVALARGLVDRSGGPEAREPFARDLPGQSGRHGGMDSFGGAGLELELAQREFGAGFEAGQARGSR